MKILILALIVGVLAISACKSNKSTPDTYTKKMITFGNMGGFAGTTNSYTVLDNGQFFKKQPRSEVVNPIKNIKKRDAGQIFSNYESLGIDKMTINDPGNLTYFIQFKNGSEEKELKWGGTQEEVPQYLKLFFTNLMTLAREQSTADNAEKM